MNISLVVPDIKKLLLEARKQILGLLFLLQVFAFIIATHRIQNDFNEGWIILALLVATVVSWGFWIGNEYNKRLRSFFSALTIILYLLTITSTFYNETYEDRVVVKGERTTLNSSIFANPLEDRIVIDKAFSLNPNHTVLSKDGNRVQVSMVIKGEIFADSDGDYSSIAVNHPKGSKYGIHPSVEVGARRHIMYLAKTRSFDDFPDKAFFENEIRHHLLNLNKLPLRNVEVEISKIEVDLSKIVYIF